MGPKVFWRLLVADSSAKIEKYDSIIAEIIASLENAWKNKQQKPVSGTNARIRNNLFPTYTKSSTPQVIIKRNDKGSYDVDEEDVCPCQRQPESWPRAFNQAPPTGPAYRNDRKEQENKRKKNRKNDKKNRKEDQKDYGKEGRQKDRDGKKKEKEGQRRRHGSGEMTVNTRGEVQFKFTDMFSETPPVYGI